jgi:hypothetical protein
LNCEVVVALARMHVLRFSEVADAFTAASREVGGDGSGRLKVEVVGVGSYTESGGNVHKGRRNATFSAFNFCTVRSVVVQLESELAPGIG